MIKLKHQLLSNGIVSMPQPGYMPFRGRVLSSSSIAGAMNSNNNLIINPMKIVYMPNMQTNSYLHARPLMHSSCQFGGCGDNLFDGNMLLGQAVGRSGIYANFANPTINGMMRRQMNRLIAPVADQYSDY